MNVMGASDEGKKHVSFHNEESLVRIVEIPGRQQRLVSSPMTEMLQPCDPKELAAEYNELAVNGSIHRGSGEYALRGSHPTNSIFNTSSIGISRYQLPNGAFSRHQGSHNSTPQRQFLCSGVRNPLLPKRQSLLRDYKSMLFDKRHESIKAQTNDTSQAHTDSSVLGDTQNSINNDDDGESEHVAKNKNVSNNFNDDELNNQLNGSWLQPKLRVHPSPYRSGSAPTAEAARRKENVAHLLRRAASENATAEIEPPTQVPTEIRGNHNQFENFTVQNRPKLLWQRKSESRRTKCSNIYTKQLTCCPQVRNVKN